VEVGSPRQCLLLAALAVDAGRVVPLEVLVDRLWGDDPPEHARRTLHAYITRLRRVVGRVYDPAGQPAAVVGRSGGYLLDVGTEEVDVHRLRRLVEQARGRSAGEQRLSLLRDAVGLGQRRGGRPGRLPR
jgi:DNA-binding SARP family transcriptional activator